MTNPLEPLISTAQMKRLHGIARRRILTHEDLRAIAGVQSLKHLTRRQAMALIDRLQADQPHGGAHVARRARPRTGGTTIKPATPGQRDLIRHLLRDCRWPLDQCRAWLQQRWQVNLDQLDAAAITTRRAAEIIGVLQKARANVHRHQESCGES